MLVSEAITQVLERTDNVPATSAENVTRRQRLLEYLTEEFAQVYDHDWTFRRTSSTVSIPASQGWGLLPTDYGSLGKFGSVWLRQGNSDRWPLTQKPESIIEDVRRSGHTTDAPNIYAIFGIDTTTGQLKIQVPMNGSAITLAVYYLMKAPTLGDGDANDGALDKYLPDQFHQLVIIPRLRARAREAKGDVRWQTSKTLAAEGLVKMKGEFMRDQASGFFQLSSFFGSGWR